LPECLAEVSDAPPSLSRCIAAVSFVPERAVVLFFCVLPRISRCDITITDNYPLKGGKMVCVTYLACVLPLCCKARVLTEQLGRGNKKQRVDFGWFLAKRGAGHQVHRACEHCRLVRAMRSAHCSSERTLQYSQESHPGTEPSRSLQASTRRTGAQPLRTYRPSIHIHWRHSYWAEEKVSLRASSLL
jgi:hypothetical protein